MRVIGIAALLCGAAIATSVQSTPQSIAVSSTQETPRVVFVCEHGSVNILIAASYFNRRA